ncbi:unnamed protein product, partial [Tuber aestivum]
MLCITLAGSGPGLCAPIVEARADGGVVMGFPRAEAQMMAAQIMQSAGRMVLAGQYPAIIREQMPTPPSCTIYGLSWKTERSARPLRGQFRRLLIC